MQLPTSLGAYKLGDSYDHQYRHVEGLSWNASLDDLIREVGVRPIEFVGSSITLGILRSHPNLADRFEGSLRSEGVVWKQ